jgi:hypothetical protein
VEPKPNPIAVYAQLPNRTNTRRFIGREGDPAVEAFMETHPVVSVLRKSIKGEEFILIITY